MRRPIIAGNWKMNLLLNEAAELTRGLMARIHGEDGPEVVLAPPFTALGTVAAMIQGTSVRLAGQNMGFADKGAYTGEISPGMLKDVGCTYVILGHSERRKYFSEDDALINKKITLALEKGLKVILCVGETLEEREENRTNDVIGRQVAGCLKGLSGCPADRLVVAYEPVWAIGTGKNATPAQAQDVHAFIRERLSEILGSGVSDEVRIQYGGSVTPQNSGAILSEKDVDGALVGGASLQVESFCAIINSQMGSGE
ncbi:MAG: triose-phosphate isomerase [Nitrospinae bacterium CG11_big_fil_rev_8_21_14_0_20_56_8]|nr:MAG: triose-phosphate isomerase [Nitrospinae bacterium CG11_big_fil_rev_8_21_14_0_20_56_8]